MVLSSRSNKIVAILLIICVIFMAFAAATEQAHALALTTSLVAVVGAALVACGFTFANSDEMSAVVQKFWDTLSSEDQTSFSDIALSFAGSSSGYLAFKLTKSMISALSSWFAADVDSSSGVNVTYGGSLFPFSFPLIDVPIPDLVNYGNTAYGNGGQLATFIFQDKGLEVGVLPNNHILKVFGFSSDSSWYQGFNSYGLPWFSNLFFYDSTYIQSLISEGKTASDYDWQVGKAWFNRVSYSDLKALSDVNTLVTVSCIFSNGFYSVSPTINGVTYSGAQSNSTDWGLSIFPLSLIAQSLASVPTTVDVPCDVVYGPNSTTEDKAKTGTDVVVSGKMVQDGALDSDYIGTMTTTGVRDVAAAEAAADSASISGIKDLVQTIATAVTTFFDPTDFSLNFEPIKAGFSDLSDVFPFCIPFDMVDAVKTFAASASDFSFDIKLDTDLLKIDHTVDLTPFKVPILFFRYVAVFWFSWILISRTRDLIKW